MYVVEDESDDVNKEIELLEVVIVVEYAGKTMKIFVKVDVFKLYGAVKLKALQVSELIGAI